MIRRILSLSCSLGLLCSQSTAFAQVDAVARGLAGASLTLNAPKNSTPGLTAFDPATALINWRIAVGQVRAGAAQAAINLIGDSEEAAYICAPGGTSNGCRALSRQAMMVQMLNGIGIPASDDNYFGNENINGGGPAYGVSAQSIGSFAAYDPRISTSGTVVIKNAGNTPSSGWFATSSLFDCAGACTLTFAPTRSVNACDYYYVNNGSLGGSATISDSNGTLTNGEVNQATTAPQVAKITVTRTTASTLPITITRTAGEIYWWGLDCYDTTAARVRVRMMAGTGWRATDFVNGDSSFGAQKWLPLLTNTSLWFNDLGSNEANTGSTQVAAATALTSLISIEQTAGGDVIVEEPHPAPNQGTDVKSGVNIYAGIQGVAAAKGLPLLDLYRRFIPFRTSLYQDNTHMLGAAGGIADEAAARMNLLRPQ